MGCFIRKEIIMSFEFEFTQGKLQEIIGKNQYIDHWYEALCQILPDYDINTVPRVAAFLAQTAHESGTIVQLKKT